MARTRVARVLSDLGRSPHKVFVLYFETISIHCVAKYIRPTSLFHYPALLSWFEYLEGLGLVLWLGMSYCLHQTELEMDGGWKRGGGEEERDEKGKKGGCTMTCRY